MDANSGALPATLLPSLSPFPIPMPKLTRLYIEADIDPSGDEYPCDWHLPGRLLSAISLPTSALLEVVIRILCEEDDSMNEECLSIWRSCITATRQHDFQALKLESQYYPSSNRSRKVRFDLHTEEGSQDSEMMKHATNGDAFIRSPSPLSITFEDCACFGGLRTEEYAGALFKFLPASQLHTIAYSGVSKYPDSDDIFDETPFIDLFGDCTHMRTLLLYNQDEILNMVPILDALNSPTIFPRLERLVLGGHVELPEVFKCLERRMKAFEEQGSTPPRLQLSVPVEAVNSGLEEDDAALASLMLYADVVFRGQVAR